MVLKKYISFSSYWFNQVFRDYSQSSFNPCREKYVQIYFFICKRYHILIFLYNFEHIFCVNDNEQFSVAIKTIKQLIWEMTYIWKTEAFMYQLLTETTILRQHMDLFAILFHIMGHTNNRISLCIVPRCQKIVTESKFSSIFLPQQPRISEWSFMVS